METSRADQFSTLPLELIELIVEFSDLDSIASLRFTCKLVYSKSWDAWARANFTTAYISFSPCGLQHLGELAHHQILSKYVQELLIFGWEDSNCPLVSNRIHDNAGELFPGLTRRPIWMFPSPKDMIWLPYFSNLLAKTLKNNLVNCNSFVITRRSMKTFRYKPRGGLQPIDFDIAAIFLSVIASVRIPVRSFQIRPNDGHSYMREHFDRCMFLGFPSALRDDDFRDMWGSYLEELSIDFAMDEESERWIPSLIHKAHNLKRLTLRPDTFDNDILVEHVLTSNMPWCPDLQELQLENLLINRSSLVEFCCRFSKSLKSLTLRHIFLPKSETWYTVFESFAKRLQKLQMFSYRSLWRNEEDSAGQQRMIHFRFAPLSSQFRDSNSSNQEPGKVQLFRRCEEPRTVSGICCSGSAVRLMHETLGMAAESRFALWSGDTLARTYHLPVN